jgi:hypothetical protein
VLHRLNILRRLGHRLLFAALLWVASAQAHKTSDSYLSLFADPAGISGKWDLALADLAPIIAFDANKDGSITWEEMRAQQGKVNAYALSHLHVWGDGEAGVVRVTDATFAQHNDGIFVVIHFTVDGFVIPRALEVQYQIFFEHDPLHRGLCLLDQGDQNQTTLFTTDHRKHRFELTAPDPVREFLTFGKEGIWHIWTGYDHILFLLALLLPAVLCREANAWQPVAAFRPAFLNVLKVVTAFTVAHSITLSLAALHLVQLPSRLVESTIAASVVLAAANNLVPLVRGRSWLVAFGFGLIHGFGFAGAMAELGVREGALLLPVVAFNLGVEAGQLAIVSVFLPLAYALRSSWFYERVTLRFGSACIIAIAATWLVERLFDFRALPL